MNAALFYRTPSRWRFWCSLLAALAIHFAAVVFAGLHAPAAIFSATDEPRESLIVAFDIPSSPVDPEPPPKPDDIPPPNPPLDSPDFIEPESTPPQNLVKPRGPIARQPGNTDVAPLSDVRARSMFAPRPAYPYEARRRQITGEGVAVLEVQTATGRVTNVTMLSSTGSNLLDQSTLAALRRWRFRPGTPARVTCPITFTMTGAQF